MKRFPTLLAALALVACGDTPVDPIPFVPDASLQVFSTTSAGDLDDPTDAYTEVATDVFQRHTPGQYNGDRLYMRTVATDYNEKDFTAELVFTLSDLAGDGATITYFGLGSGEPDPDTRFHNEATGVLFRIHAPEREAGGHTDISARNPGEGYLVIRRLTDNYGPSGSTHRTIITKSGSVVTLDFDKYNDGTVDATDAIDLSAYPGLLLDNTNSRIFFGTSTQDEFHLTITESSTDPETMADCKKGGWADYGFRNQGQCIRFVNTGKDSR